MFSADVHRITKVVDIVVSPLGKGFGDGGYITLTLHTEEDATAKFTLFSNDLPTMWEQFGNAMLKADAVYEGIPEGVQA